MSKPNSEKNKDSEKLKNAEETDRRVKDRLIFLGRILSVTRPDLEIAPKPTQSNRGKQIKIDIADSCSAEVPGR